MLPPSALGNERLEFLPRAGKSGQKPRLLVLRRLPFGECRYEGERNGGF